MKKRGYVAIGLALLCAFLALTLPAQTKDKPATPATPPATAKPAAPATPSATAKPAAPATPATSVDIPALDSFHEVIAPLWHTAWQNKDFKMMKDMLPDVKEKAEALEKAPLPAALKDKADLWTDDTEAMKVAVTAYEKAAAASDEQGLLNSVQQIHALFEAMARLAYPKMEELTKYHAVLYQVYHKYLPSKDLLDVRMACENLISLCNDIQKAEIPPRFQDKEPKLKEGFSSLCSATHDLKTVAASDDVAAIQAAVENVREQYDAVDKMLGRDH